MTPRTALIGAGLAALVLGALIATPAGARPGLDDQHDNQHAAAIEACQAANPYSPELTKLIHNGDMTLVWMDDANKDLWMCVADDNGAVYSYTMVADSLFVHKTKREEFPAGVGEKKMLTTGAASACVAHVPDWNSKNIVAVMDDGRDGYLVFVRDPAGYSYVCDAKAEKTNHGDVVGFVYAFEPLGAPLTQPTVA